MMACVAASLLALLLNYLASAEGALAPPLNLSVELLDFTALVRWLPGPGNPKGTRYSLEFIDIDHFLASSWNQTGNCTNIFSTQCYLILNQRIEKEYYVRVMAQWMEERSEWTCLSQSFQPYEYTLLSAPILSVSSEHHSIQIFLSHPVQLLTDVQMRFSVDLFQMISNSIAKYHIAQNITTKSTHFEKLPFGTYCIYASAFLTAKSKCNTNATKCVILHQDQKKGKEWVVTVGIFVLMSVPAVIGLIFIYFYVRPFNNGYIPEALHILKRTRMVQALDTEELRTLPISRMSTDYCTATHQETDENSFQGYCDGITRKVICGSVQNIEDDLLSQIVAEADQNLPYSGHGLYSTAVMIEEATECLTQTECSTPRTSFSDMSTAYGQNHKLKTTSDSELEEFDEENYGISSEQKDSLEGEMDSQHSDFVFGSNYEPRPDPRWTLDGQFRSKP